MTFGYFEARATLPLIAFITYLIFGRRSPKWFTWLGVITYLGIAAVLLGLKSSGLSLPALIGKNLYYESAVEAMLFGALVVYVLRRKVALSLIASILSISSVGWLYEVSFEHPIEMFINPPSLVSPFILHPQIVFLLMLLGTLFLNGWRPGRLSLFTLLFYAVYSIFLFFMYYPIAQSNNHSVFGWFIRLPSYALIFSLIWETKISNNDTPQPRQHRQS